MILINKPKVIVIGGPTASGKTALSIALAKKYTRLVDEKYQKESLTNDLTSPASLAREGANAKEILYRQVGVSGLGDYSRNSGYTNNSVTVEWKTATFNYDRGTKITLDTINLVCA